MVIEHEREHDSKSNTDRFIVSRYGQNVDAEEEDARCGCYVMTESSRQTPFGIETSRQTSISDGEGRQANSFTQDELRRLRRGGGR
jgi:hypothetical protein